LTEHLRGLVREGYGVRLEPMRAEHAELCVGKVDPGLFRYFIGGGPQTDDLEGWADFLMSVAGASGVAAYTILDSKTGGLRGGTAYLDIRPQHKALEIGFSWVVPAWQRTFVNPAAKFLMLTTAFDEYELNRVQLKCDNRNEQSKANILKLGAKFEGVLRQHVVMADGFIRDTAMYSIIHAEWPDVRDGLLQRLSGCE
jgi:N-acetyltransferase